MPNTKAKTSAAFEFLAAQWSPGDSVVMELIRNSTTDAYTGTVGLSDLIIECQAEAVYA